MKDVIKEFLVSALGAEESAGVLSILEVDDFKFTVVYPSLSENLTKQFNSQEYKQSIQKACRETGKEQMKLECEFAKKILKEIETDDSISETKKQFLLSIFENIINPIEEFLATGGREKVSVKVEKITDKAILPTYANQGDAGADIYASSTISIKPHTTELIPTGLKVAIPNGYEIQIRPRSGLSLKTSLRVANAPGTIDCGYRGEVCVIMENTGNLTCTINEGDRIAQMVISPVPMIDWELTDSVDDETERGKGGFGSSDSSGE